MSRMDKFPYHTLPVYLVVFVWMCMSSLAVHYLSEDLVFMANLEENCRQAGFSGAFEADENDHQDDLVLSATMISGISAQHPVENFSQELFGHPQPVLPLLPPPKI